MAYLSWSPIERDHTDNNKYTLSSPSVVMSGTKQACCWHHGHFRSFTGDNRLVSDNIELSGTSQKYLEAKGSHKQLLGHHICGRTFSGKSGLLHWGHQSHVWQTTDLSKTPKTCKGSPKGTKAVLVWIFAEPPWPPPPPLVSFDMFQELFFQLHIKQAKVPQKFRFWSGPSPAPFSWKKSNI